MFIATLFKVVKPQKQPTCLSVDYWIKNMWYTYTMEYYSATTKDKILAFDIRSVFEISGESLF